MSTIRIDKSRPHVEVHGETTHGLAMRQDGLPFNSQGELIEALVKADQKDLVERKRRKLAKPAKKLEDDPATPAADSDPEPDEDAEDGNEVNLTSWLKDEVKYPWHEVAKAAKSRFSKHFTSAKQLAEFLVYEEQIVGPDEVPTKLKDA